jgi:hypothetical protein
LNFCSPLKSGTIKNGLISIVFLVISNISISRFRISIPNTKKHLLVSYTPLCSGHRPHRQISRKVSLQSQYLRCLSGFLKYTALESHMSVYVAQRPMSSSDFKFLTSCPKRYTLQKQTVGREQGHVLRRNSLHRQQNQKEMM